MIDALTAVLGIFLCGFASGALFEAWLNRRDDELP